MKHYLASFCLLSALIFIAPSTQANNALYQLSFANVDDEQVTLSEYKGKIVILNFWATWCPPCIKEMPSMQRLKEKMADQPFEIVAVNVGESAAAVSSFLLELEPELTFPIMLDEEGSSFGKLGLRGLPMSLIYDQKGNLVTTILGGKEWDTSENIQELKQLINPKQSDTQH